MQISDSRSDRTPYINFFGEPDGPDSAVALKNTEKVQHEAPARELSKGQPPTVSKSQPTTVQAGAGPSDPAPLQPPATNKSYSTQDARRQGRAKGAKSKHYMASQVSRRSSRVMNYDDGGAQSLNKVSGNSDGKVPRSQQMPSHANHHINGAHEPPTYLRHTISRVSPGEYGAPTTHSAALRMHNHIHLDSPSESFSSHFNHHQKYQGGKSDMPPYQGKEQYMAGPSNEPPPPKIGQYYPGVPVVKFVPSSTPARPIDNLHAILAAFNEELDRLYQATLIPNALGDPAVNVWKEDVMTRLATEVVPALGVAVSRIGHAVRNSMQTNEASIVINDQGVNNFGYQQYAQNPAPVPQYQAQPGCPTPQTVTQEGPYNDARMHHAANQLAHMSGVQTGGQPWVRGGQVMMPPEPFSTDAHFAAIQRELNSGTPVDNVLGAPSGPRNAELRAIRAAKGPRRSLRSAAAQSHAHAQAQAYAHADEPVKSIE